MEPTLVGIREAAAALGVSRDTVRRLIASSQLQSVRISRRVLVPISEIRRICHTASGAAPNERDGLSSPPQAREAQR